MAKSSVKAEALGGVSKGWFILTSPPHALNYCKCFFSTTPECAQMGFGIRAATFHLGAELETVCCRTWIWWKWIYLSARLKDLLDADAGRAGKGELCWRPMRSSPCAAGGGGGEMTDSHAGKQMITHPHSKQHNPLEHNALCGCVHCSSQTHPLWLSPSLLAFPSPQGSCQIWRDPRKVPKDLFQLII